MLSSWVAIACNLLLFAVKFILGFLSNSIAITGDAFNNLSDVGSGVVTFIGFRRQLRQRTKTTRSGMDGLSISAAGYHFFVTAGRL